MTTLAKLTQSALAVFFMLSAPLAFGTLIEFDYNGICLDGQSNDPVFQCSNIGLNNLDPVSGYLQADSASLADLILTGNEVRNFGDYNFTFGNTLFNSGNSFLSGFAALDADWNIIGGLFNFNNLFTAANTLTFTPTGGGVFTVRRGRNLAGGIGQYTTVPVPEPGTLALLGIGLVGMGLARRRRKV